MIVYVNGDSHAAGAEAVNGCAVAADDPQYQFLKNLPHPDNIRVSFGQLIADNLQAEFYCDAESGCSNARIIRTTREYIQNNRPDLIIICWSTWEREEWLWQGQYYQITGNSTNLPKELTDRYQQWVIDRLAPNEYCQIQHDQIWQLHQDLEQQAIPHLFFNSYSNLEVKDQKDWGNSYIDPYSQSSTYWDWCTGNGFNPTKYYHFRFDAHMSWANHLTKIINDSIITK